MLKKSKAVAKQWLAKVRVNSKPSSARKFASPVSLPGSKMMNERSELVSSSHPQSNIRFSRPEVPEDETSWEKEYRLQSEQVQLWNHEFWQKNNIRFNQVP
jgi:hypothetical protein